MRRTRTLPAACVALASVASGCHKPISAEAIEASPAAMAQQGPSGTSTWIVAPDGAVSATLKTPDGKSVTQPVTGQVAFAPPSGPPVTVPVQYNAKTGVLTAAGPKLDADITPVRYALTVGGTPWNGSIDVPRGGTQDLVDTAKVQAAAPMPAVGPNGGVVQVVGPDRVEVVANKQTGDVRAYVLGPDNTPVDPGDRKITLALEDESPEVVVLAPEPHGRFVFGRVRTRVDPVHVTIAVNAHGATHACLVGWAPGSAVFVGLAAPRVHLLAVDAWPGEVVVEGRGHRGHGRVMVAGEPGLVVESPSIVVGAPQVVVGGPSIIMAGPSAVVGAPGVVVGRPGTAVGPGGNQGPEHGHGHHPH